MFLSVYAYTGNRIDSVPYRSVPLAEFRTVNQINCVPYRDEADPHDRSAEALHLRTLRCRGS